MRDPKIIDCFTFYNEKKMLEFRLMELYDSVDYFIIVEATSTHAGHPKPLYFNNDKKRFKKYLDKIIHVVVDDMPNTKNPWDNENHQRNCINRGLELLNLNDDDRILITDCDEVWDCNTVKNLDIGDEVLCLEQDFYYYNFNCKFIEKWHFPKILKYSKYLTSPYPNNIRQYNCNIVINGGWHLSYFGNVDFIKNKLRNFAHQELNTHEVLESVQSHKDNSTDFVPPDPNIWEGGIRHGGVDVEDELKNKLPSYLPKFYKELLEMESY